MDVVFTEAIQLGLARGESFIFEERLAAMASLLGRPLPELRGGMIFGAPLEGDWYAECTIRAPLATPTVEAYVFRAVDRSWNEVAVRVIQESVARLAYLGDYMFIGSRFELIGRRDEDGMPLPFAPDSATVGPHLDDMEILLHRTQCRLDDLRFDHRHTTVANQALVAEVEELRSELDVTTEQTAALTHQLFELRQEHDATVARNRALESQLRTTRLARNRITKKVEVLEEASSVLRGRLKTAREDLATRDSTVEELEEEITELRRENEELLPVDDVPSDFDGMDMSDESEQEDDDLVGEEEDPEEVVFEVEDDDDQE